MCMVLNQMQFFMFETAIENVCCSCECMSRLNWFNRVLTSRNIIMDIKAYAIKYLSSTQTCSAVTTAISVCAVHNLHISSKRSVMIALIQTAQESFRIKYSRHTHTHTYACYEITSGRQTLIAKFMSDWTEYVRSRKNAF